MTTERLHPFRVEIPDPMDQKEMENLILTYFAIVDRTAVGGTFRGRSQWIRDRLSRLGGFEEAALQDMILYAARDSASSWALTVVPPWAAAGMLASIRPDSEVHSPSTLWMFAGMEQRKYIHPDHARSIIDDVLWGLTESQIGEKHLRLLAERLDRPPSLVGTNPTRKEIWRWATKRRHNEFLRTVALRLGGHIESDRQNYYHRAYQDALERQGQQALDFDTGAPINELSHYARNHSVRSFLNDYFAHMDRGPRVLQ